jgi:O-antigen ligase
VSLADLVFVVAGCAWIFGLITKRTRIYWSWFYVPLGLYLIVLSLSALASVNQHLSAIKLIGKIYLIALAILSFNVVRSTGFMRRTAAAWQVGTIATIVGSFVGIVLFYAGLKNPAFNRVLHGYGSLPKGNYPRISGLFDYAAMLCNYLSVSLMLALMMWSVGWLTTRWLRPLIIGILGTSLFTFTPSLGGVPLSLGIWLCLYLKERGRPMLARIALVGAIALAISVFAASAVTFYSYTWDGTESPAAHAELKASRRTIAWQTAFQTFKQYPILGRGVGLPVSSAPYVNPSGGRGTLTDAHNTYLSLAGESGLLGILAFGGIIVFLFWGWAPLQLTGPVNLVIKTYLILALVDAFLFQSLVGSFEDTRHLWVLFGMLAATKEGFETPVKPSA